MMRVEDIEEAVAGLAPEKLAKFRAWFEEFDTARFDDEIEHESRNGKLDSFADQAVRDSREGRAKEF